MNREQWKAHIRDNIRNTFDESELYSLAFDFNINRGEISGRSLTEKTENLIYYMERHNRLPNLIQKLREKRPNINWPAPPPMPGSSISQRSSRSSEANETQPEHPVIQWAKENLGKTLAGVFIAGMVFIIIVAQLGVSDGIEVWGISLPFPVVEVTRVVEVPQVVEVEVTREVIQFATLEPEEPVLRITFPIDEGCVERETTFQGIQSNLPLEKKPWIVIYTPGSGQYYFTPIDSPQEEPWNVETRIGREEPLDNGEMFIITVLIANVEADSTLTAMYHNLAVESLGFLPAGVELMHSITVTRNPC